MAAEFSPQGNLGALFIGVLFSCFLFGIATLQGYIYYLRFPNDGLRIKLLVLFVYSFELVHCACVCHSAYYLTIIGYGKPDMLLKTPATLALSVGFISGAIGVSVQLFFIERLRVLSQKLVIPIICGTLSITRFAMSIYLSVEGLRTPTFEKFLNKLEWLLTTMISMGVFVDLFIATSLCLWFTKNKANAMKRTARDIEKIMAWTCQTGLLTSVAGIIFLICFKTMPKNYVWIAFFTSLIRIYSNTLLASLNARTIFRRTDVVDAQITALMQELDMPRAAVSRIIFQRTKTTQDEENGSALREVSGSETTGHVTIDESMTVER